MVAPTGDPGLRGVCRHEESLHRPEDCRIGLLILGLGCAAYLVFGTKPWETEWAAREAAGKVPYLRDYMAGGFWWAAWAVGALAVILAGSTSLWVSARDS